MRVVDDEDDEFCWTCNGDWNTHRQFNKIESVASEATERELEMDLHHFNQYHILAHAQKLAEKQLAQSQSRLFNEGFYPEDDQCLFNTRIIVESMMKASAKLVESRRRLKHRYIFACYRLQNIELEQFTRFDQQTQRLCLQS